MNYPESRKDNVVDDYHGTEIADPYRWLEDPDSEESRRWIQAQNKLTFGFLETIPERTRIRERITHLWNFEKYGIPQKKGDRYFYTKNDGLQNQSVIYVADSLDAEPRVLLDPNQLSPDGTVAVTGTSLSEDGLLMAYGLSTSGSDWMEWKIRNVESGIDLPDQLKWIKFSGASWLPDNSGFFYSRYREPAPGDALEETNYHQKLYFHRTGDPQSLDQLIYERPDQKEWGFSGIVTEDGRFLVIHVWKGTGPMNLIFYKDLSGSTNPVVELITEFEAEFSFIMNQGPLFFFKTNHSAPRGRVIAIDIHNPEREAVREIVPQSSETLESAGVVKDRLILTYLKDAHSRVRILDLSGHDARDVDLPGLGTVAGFSGKKEDVETFYAYTSFNVPASIYRFDPETGLSELFRKPVVDFDPDDYETRQVFYQSKDGTRIPMFLNHKKGFERNGLAPAYLYGYGGFNISLTPAFSAGALVWMEMGGLYAVANLRGGGEYGEDWHEAGAKSKKQNGFDDFIAAADWLIREEYTSSPKLAIGGGSNGGLLVGACMTQRPDLFGAVLPAVGVLDMLRFQKFTIGWAWVDDYGSSDNADEFQILLKYSPLHNLKPGVCYPATLITTADHDDRVVPAHSFKFAAALQNAQGCPAPVLIRIETRSGHGAGKPTTRLIEEAADKWSFLLRVLNP